MSISSVQVYPSSAGEFKTILPILMYSMVPHFSIEFRNHLAPSARQLQQQINELGNMYYTICGKCRPVYDCRWPV